MSAASLKRKRWAAGAAIAFCGYLSLATSEVPPNPCHGQAWTIERSFTPEDETDVSQWRLTATPRGPITRWEVVVAPSTALVYVPSRGVEVPVFDSAHPGLSTPRAAPDAGHGTSAPWSDAGRGSDAPERVLPPDHVIAEDGRLVLVCEGDRTLCEEVTLNVHVARQEAAEFTLTATAISSMCSGPGELISLRMERVSP